MADRNIRIDITAADKTRGGINSARAGLRSLEDGVNSVRGVYAGLAGVAATLGVSKVIGEAINANAEWEQSNKRLDGVLRATGQTVGFTRNEIENMVQSMEGSTLFSQNEIRDATSIMLTFRSVMGDTFTDGMRLAADMSAVMDQSLKTSVVQLGKALEDPIRGLSSLREVGVSFTAQQEEMIKKLVESGDKMKAQGVIIETLEKQFGGTAEAENKGLKGAIQSTREEWEKLLIAVGKQDEITGATNVFFRAVEGGLRSIREEIEKGNWAATYLKILGRAVPGVGPALRAIGEEMQKKDEQRQGMSSVIETENEVQRQADARRKQRDEAEQQRQADKAAREAKLAEDKKKEDEKRAKENAKLAQEEFDHWESLIAIRWQYQQDEKQRRLEQIKLNAEEAQSTDDMINGVVADYERDVQAKKDALLEKTKAVTDSIASDYGLLLRDFQEKSKILDAAEAAGFEIEGGWKAQHLRLTEWFQDRETEMIDAAYRKRYGIAHVYRKLDLQSAQFFFGQLGQMMESGNRKMFEIGKAGAIAETIIQTYRAAQGAYAALASIPLVGPALGAAAAAAAIVSGIARVQQIKNTEFGGGVAGGAVPTFNANPVTGVPTSPPIAEAPQQIQEAQQATQAPRVVNISIKSDSGVVSTSWVRDELLPSINEALGDGVVLNVG